jgi:hypothetical protein
MSYFLFLACNGQKNKTTGSSCSLLFVSEHYCSNYNTSFLFIFTKATHPFNCQTMPPGGINNEKQAGRGIDWMYQGTTARQEETKAEEEAFLLGKEFNPSNAKSGDLAIGSESTGMNRVVGGLGSVDRSTNIDTSYNNASQTATAAAAGWKEDFQTRHEDPMYMVNQTQREKERDRRRKKELFARTTTTTVTDGTTNRKRRSERGRKRSRSKKLERRERDQHQHQYQHHRVKMKDDVDGTREKRGKKGGIDNDLVLILDHAVVIVKIRDILVGGIDIEIVIGGSVAYLEVEVLPMKENHEGIREIYHRGIVIHKEIEIEIEVGAGAGVPIASDKIEEVIITKKKKRAREQVMKRMSILLQLKQKYLV